MKGDPFVPKSAWKHAIIQGEESLSGLLVEMIADGLRQPVEIAEGHVDRVLAELHKNSAYLEHDRRQN